MDGGCQSPPKEKENSGFFLFGWGFFYLNSICLIHLAHWEILNAQTWQAANSYKVQGNNDIQESSPWLVSMLRFKTQTAILIFLVISGADWKQNKNIHVRKVMKYSVWSSNFLFNTSTLCYWFLYITPWIITL